MKSLFLIISVALWQSGFSQKLQLVSSVDKNMILIGEPLQLKLKAFVSAETPVQWPSIDSVVHFEVLSRSKIDSQLNNNILVLNQTITMTSWDSGKWRIPSFSLPGSGKTKPITIDVAFAPFNRDQEYNDIKDILEVSKPQRSKWHWYVIGLLLVLFVFLLLFPARKVKKAIPKFVSDRNIYEQSLARLENLRKNTPADPKILYTELIVIFRDYLLKRKAIQSYSKTTDDLAIRISALGLPADNYQPLVQALQLSDLVKFAQFQPPATDNLAAIQTIIQSISAIENLK